MEGLEQRYIWVVTNENFEKALNVIKAERNSRVIPSPFFSGTITFSTEKDLQDFFFVLLKPYYENLSRRQVLYFSFVAAELLIAHEYVKEYLRPSEKHFVQCTIED